MKNKVDLLKKEEGPEFEKGYTHGLINGRRLADVDRVMPMVRDVLRACDLNVRQILDILFFVNEAPVEELKEWIEEREIYNNNPDSKLYNPFHDEGY